ncbi:hypothetical protein ACLQ3K_16165 [Tsukamurella sp. DT100]|uniref:hypothetical protein n=1 Tax=Tsukamurella sp. DT100 TaxID=3393415 RepID=UPI003CEDC455
MNYDTMRDYLRRLDTRLYLLPERVGEWAESIGSPWVDGVSSPAHNQDPNLAVHLHRSANNQPQYGKPILEHEVCVRWSARGNVGNELSMPPESAIQLGRYLTEAGTAAIRDRARHADWLLGVVEVTVETPEVVLTPAESLPLTQVGSGRHEKLATVRAGQAAVTAERFDYRPDDGTPALVEWALRAQTTGMDGDYEVDLTSEDVEGMRRQVANVVGALTRVMEVFDDEAEKVLRGARGEV